MLRRATLGYDKRMSKKKLLLIIIAVLALVAAALAIFKFNSKDDNGTQQKNTPDTSQNEPDTSLLGETFTDSESGVSMQIPKGWQLAPKDDENPSSLTKFVQSQSGPGANGELLARHTNVHIDDIVRGYLEAAMDINATPKLVDNQDERIGNKVVRLLSQEMPGPGGVTGRITQYIMYRNGTYYILAYTMLSSDWEAQRPGIEESVKSLKLP